MYKIGMLEYWNTGALGFNHYSVNPTFHNSILRVDTKEPDSIYRRIRERAEIWR
jgi:hypothetical protein